MTNGHQPNGVRAMIEATRRLTNELFGAECHTTCRSLRDLAHPSNNWRLRGDVHGGR